MMKVSTTLAALLASFVSAQSQSILSKYTADIASYVNGLISQPAVIDAFGAIQSVDSAAFESLLLHPASALAAATTAGQPSFYSLLPSSALAVIESIDAHALAIYTSDVIDYSASAMPSAGSTATMATSTSLSAMSTAPSSGSTAAMTTAMMTTMPKATSSASAAAASSSSTAGVEHAVALNIAGAAACAIGAAAALL